MPLTPSFPTADSRSVWPSRFRGLHRGLVAGRPTVEVTVVEGDGDIDGDPVYECIYIYDADTGDFITRAPMVQAAIDERQLVSRRPCESITPVGWSS